MKVSVSQAELPAVEAGLLSVGLCEGEELPAGFATAPGATDAKASFKKLTLLPPEQPGRVLVVGLGKREDLDAERARIAAALAAKEASKLGVTSLAWAVPEHADRDAL